MATQRIFRLHILFSDLDHHHDYPRFVKSSTSRFYRKNVEWDDVLQKVPRLNTAIDRETFVRWSILHQFAVDAD